MAARWNWDAWPSNYFSFAMTKFLLSIAGQNGQARVLKELKNFGVDDGQIEFFPSTKSLPAAFGYVTSDSLLIGISGTDSFRQVLRYTFPPTLYGSCTADGRKGAFYVDNNTSFACNFQFVDWGRDVFERIAQRPELLKRRIFLTGHSYGGAVAIAAATLLGQVCARGQVTVITFGSPKVADERWYRPLDSQNVIRWMNIGDPVPALPPNSGEQGVPIGLLKKTQFEILLPAIDQTKGGKLVRENFKVVSAASPQITPGLLTIALDAFSDRESDLLNPFQHYLSRYSDVMLALTAIAVTSRGGSLKEVLPADVAAAFAVSNPHAFAAVGQREQFVARVVPPQLLGLMEAPVAISAFIPAEFRPKVQRIGGNDYICKWQDLIVMRGNRGQVKTFASHLYKFSKRWAYAFNVDSDVLAQAFRIFTVLSQGGDSSWRPPVWPVTGTFDPATS